ncbi:MAG TPA: lamin tail domain-containing protein [Polyangia bacterium]|jgi:hypothetical protein|nr:lamin tail domain-containing protein [Polyangia bacterium]
MFKSVSVSWLLILASVATALMAVATGCLPEVPGGASSDALKEAPRPIDTSAAEAPAAAVNVPTDAAVDASQEPATATPPAGLLPPAPSPDAAPAERAPAAADGAAELVDAVTERIDTGAAVIDVRPDVVAAGPEVVDAGPEAVDVGPEVVDTGPEAVDVRPEVVDTGAGRVDMGTTVADSGPEIVDVAASETAGADMSAPCPCPIHDAAPPPGNREPLPGEIVINEMLVNPAGTDIGREWIEVRNLATVPLNLAQLHVADLLTDVAVSAGVLAPGDVLLLGQSLDATKNGGAPIAVTYGTTVSLNNDGDTISLCWGACATGVVLDRYTYGTLGTAYDGHALILSPSPDPARKGCPAQDSFGTGGSYGTPGRPNPLCPP